MTSHVSSGSGNSSSDSSGSDWWHDRAPAPFILSYQHTQMNTIGLVRVIGGVSDAAFHELFSTNATKTKPQLPPLPSPLPPPPPPRPPPLSRRQLWDTKVCVLPDVFSLFQKKQWARARAEVAAYDLHGVLNSYRRPRMDPGYDSLHLKVCPPGRRRPLAPPVTSTPSPSGTPV